MTLLATAARWIAIAIAIAGVIDPALSLPGYQTPVVRVVSGAREDASGVTAALENAGFRSDPATSPAATVLVTDEVSSRDANRALPVGTWIVDTTPAPPNVRTQRITAPAFRFPGQAVALSVDVRGEGLRGKSTALTLEDAGLPVASATHTWASDAETWRAEFQYLPPFAGAGRLRVIAAPVTGETATSDNAADVLVPAVRGPVRILIVEAAVTWPALFVRRALEGEGAFSIASTQRASKAAVTRAGAPPPALTRDSVAGYEVVVVGGPGNLRGSDLAILEWFVEQRGGVVVFVPDERPSGAWLTMTGVGAFDLAALADPVRLDGGLLASELAIPRGLPPAATVLGSDPQRRPVVFVARRGAGAVIVSGALDAWRHRAAGEEAFARFWRQTIATAAVGVPAPIQVSVEPAIARPGDPVTVEVRLRDTELSPGADRVAVSLDVRAVNPQAKSDVSVRLWPTAEPGVFSGRWHAAQAGTYDITASVNGSRADATLMAAADAAPSHPPASDALGLRARVSGGRAYTAARLDEMIAALKSSYPSAWVTRRLHPMRSAWWCVPFAALLCIEWAFRRKRGLS